MAIVVVVVNFDKYDTQVLRVVVDVVRIWAELKVLSGKTSFLLDRDEHEDFHVMEPNEGDGKAEIKDGVGPRVELGVGDFLGGFVVKDEDEEDL